MITYHPNLSSKFEEFSIPIPLRDDRSEKVVKAIGGSFIERLENIAILSKEDLLLAHCCEYIEDLFSDRLATHIRECFELDKYVPKSDSLELESLRDHIIFQASATFLSMQKALNEKYVFHLGGGMHHAYSYKGSGFCLINDIVIGIRKLQELKKIANAWVIDVDVHKGDGTSEITRDDESISTLSIHMAKGWPLDNPNNSDDCYISSTIDVPIEKGEEGIYLGRLEKELTSLRQTGPVDFAVVVMGADPYEKDELASSRGIDLNLGEMLKRDMLIYNFLKEEGVPQVYLMGGGYGEFSWQVYYQFLKEILSLS